ncbi:Crp/Fnr family transcriptional regulator [Dichotomicrobium thermohalophilum]|uniref:CRP/FNR family transcriptional regulator n=1 Tax=Dichotomicrobium thermohalophilum TaxID=933063 RepID=A0A397Q315_9HYPH|nr:Crp/Fnr family transcriptional regulator [Dichotomicrobium thermohalophilum]RIA55323.1 CRP/FNR family transcriptional regulator [Dichotomicrobium thermohalophilum]
MFQSKALPKHCDVCTIRRRSICGALSADEIEAMNQIAHRRHCEAGAVIMHEGEKQDCFGNVLNGVVKLTKTMTDGRQHIVGLLFPSDFLGRAMRVESPYRAEAVTDVELCLFPRADFERIMLRYPDLQSRLLAHTLDELDACHDWTLLLGRKNAFERVASFLLMIARRAQDLGCKADPNEDSAAFVLPLGRSDIADFLGLTTESVSRQITKMKRDGVISLHGNREVQVPSMGQLLKLADLAPCDTRA